MRRRRPTSSRRSSARATAQSSRSSSTRENGKLSTPERRAAINAALAKAGAQQYATDVSGPFADNNQRLSKTHPGIGYAEVQFSKDGFQLSRGKIVNLEDSMRATLSAGRHPGRVHR